MATFVLVHSTWAGGWVWRKVIPLLRAAGHDVHATTATGQGDRVHLAGPTVDLDTHITDVVNVLKFEELVDVTLVGWGDGGMTITGVAEQVPERLAALVYFDASVPADGEDGYDALFASEDDRASFRAAGEAAGRPGYLVVDQRMLGWIEPLIPDPADRAWFLPKLVPQPIATFTQPIRLGNPAAAAVPRIFVRCTEGGDESENPMVVHARSSQDWQYRELAVNHLAPINAPQATAQFLMSLVQAASTD